MKTNSKILICLLIVLFVSACVQNGTQQIDFAVPTPLPDSMMNKRNHKNLIAVYEGNTLCYENKDGTKTYYLYSAPVEENTSRIEQSDNRFITTGKYTDKAYPEIFSENTGITITKNNFSFTIYPYENKAFPGVLTDSQNIHGQNLQCVNYGKLFGENTDLNIFSTTFGINTELIFLKKPNENTFNIKLKLSENLVPHTLSPDYILFKDAMEDGAVKAIVYTPLLTDQNKNWCFDNSVILTEKDSETNTYTIEYRINQEFLNNAVYPIKANQSVYAYIPKQPDTSAYSDTGDEVRHYLSPYMLLGDSTFKGEGYTFVRYETLDTLDIEPDKIISAKYNFCNLFEPENKTTISAYAVTEDWCSINTIWLTVPKYDKKAISSVEVKEAGLYSLNLTSFIKAILKNKNKSDALYTVNNSFFIKSETKNSSIILPSGDNGLLSPFLEIVTEQ